MSGRHECNPLRALACVALAWVLVSLASLRVARAGDTNAIAIDLSAESDDQPAYLCVLERALPFTKEAGPSATQPLTALSGVLGRDPASGDWIGAPPVGSAASATSNEQALRALVVPAAPVCGEDRPSCLPRFHEPTSAIWTTSNITCARNSSAVGAHPRVLVISVTDEKTGAKITGVTLNGNVASIWLSIALEPGDYVTATVRGGHYLESDSARSVVDRIVLPITPRCRINEVAVPRMRKDDRQRIHLDYASTDSQNAATCDVPAREVSLVMLPSNLAGSLDGCLVDDESVKSCKDPQHRAASFRSDWSTSKPPARIDLLATEVSFSWEVQQCVYPVKLACPVAKLFEAGFDCKPGTWVVTSGKPTRCDYTCTSLSATNATALPTSVRFSVEPHEDRWDEPLAYIGQTLSGYANRDTREFIVDLGAWKGTGLRTIGDHIRELVITGPSGLTYHLNTDWDIDPITKLPDPKHYEQRVVFPGATCGDFVTYRVVGDRDYRDGLAEIKDGRIDIPQPYLKARVFTYGGGVGGGLSVPLPFEQAKALPYGSVQLAGAWHLLTPQKIPWFWSLYVEWIELRAGYAFGNTSYTPVDTTTNGGKASVATVPFNRFFFDLIPMWFLGDAVMFGATPGSITLGHPTFQKDEVRVSSLKAIWSPFATLRVLLSHHFALDFEARLQYPERQYTYRDNGFIGSPAREEKFVLLTSLGMNLRFWL